MIELGPIAYSEQGAARIAYVVKGNPLELGQLEIHTTSQTLTTCYPLTHLLCAVLAVLSLLLYFLYLHG